VSPSASAVLSILITCLGVGALRGRGPLLARVPHTHVALRGRWLARKERTDPVGVLCPKVRVNAGRQYAISDVRQAVLAQVRRAQKLERPAPSRPILAQELVRQAFEARIS
jgi:hypothetical protein